MRFLFTRRWLLFALAVAAAAYLATLLGQWQFHRLDERRESNARVARNLDRPPVPVDDVLRAGRPADRDDEWRRVVVHGTWDDANTIVLKYQTREGAAGVDVVTPLRTEAGPAVLVDRGWMGTENTGGQRPETPAAASGTVTVIGWVRVDGTGRSTRVDDLSARAISSKEAAKVLPYPLYGGFLDLHTESPRPATSLEAVELPDDTSEGPHFFYGLQWWFFGALAVFGFGYLAYDEWRRARSDTD
ncbi:MAG: SURF1 family protein [Nocardioidaceae bacterium]|nr:SURF1 family protein [Nocardioidaceae bacterium]